MTYDKTSVDIEEMWNVFVNENLISECLRAAAGNEVIPIRIFVMIVDRGKVH